MIFHQPLCDQGQCYILLGSPRNSFINAAGFAPLDNGICARETTSNLSSEEAESINSPGDDKQYQTLPLTVNVGIDCQEEGDWVGSLPTCSHWQH